MTKKLLSDFAEEVRQLRIRAQSPPNKTLDIASDFVQMVVESVAKKNRSVPGLRLWFAQACAVPNNSDPRPLTPNEAKELSAITGIDFFYRTPGQSLRCKELLTIHHAHLLSQEAI